MNLRMLFFFFGMSATALAATTADQATCPVHLDHIDIRYNHAGGMSRPQLNTAFTNQAKSAVSRMLFSLSIQDQTGNQQTYPDDLIYKKEPVPAGEHRTYTWTLDAAHVDMHHTGETLTLESVEYSDGTSWKDDGSLSCTLSVDFRAK